MKTIETLWEILTKQFENSSEDSNNSTNSLDPNVSPPQKRLRRLLEFKTAKELEDLKSVAVEVVELKDYAEWFLSRSEPNIDQILNPKTYNEWYSTLETEAKANVILDGPTYSTWYQHFVVHGIEPSPRQGETEATYQKNKRYGQLALAHFNATRDSTEDYVYKWQSEILEYEEFIHLNFYARLKVSETIQLFFAEVDSENKVTLCCILHSEEYDRTYDTLQDLSAWNAWSTIQSAGTAGIYEQLDRSRYLPSTTYMV